MGPTSAAVSVRSAVEAFYRVLLMREPDLPGLNANVALITEGQRTLEETLAAFFKSEEFQSIAPRVLESYAPAPQTRFTNDHTQYGEFGILLRQWVNAGASHRIVVDVGARGKERSNSYDLLKEFGWRGVLIEANPLLLAAIQAEFDGLDYELLNVAISDYDGSAVLHIGINDDVSSLDPGAAGAWGQIQGTVGVEVRRLHPLLQAREIPPDFDVLSLDIEGEDIKALNDLIGAGYYCPRWVIIEASFNYATRSLHELALSEAVKARYRIVGQTPANLILKWNEQS